MLICPQQWNRFGRTSLEILCWQSLRNVVISKSGEIWYNIMLNCYVLIQRSHKMLHLEHCTSVGVSKL